MSAIKAGDLVCVVRPMRCGCSNSIGRIFVVPKVFVADKPGRCKYCSTDTFDTGTLLVQTRNAYTVMEVSRLKKIDPPATGDSLPTRKDMKEPA